MDKHRYAKMKGIGDYKKKNNVEYYYLRFGFPSL